MRSERTDRETACQATSAGAAPGSTAARRRTARAVAAAAAKVALGMLAGLAVLGAAPTARAFCRTTTVSVTPDFNPRPGVCWTQGLPLWWRNACVSYDIQHDASRQMSYDDASNIITQAFTKWTGASCPTSGNGTSRVSIDVRDLGPVNCGLVQYNTDGGNQHVIVFRDDSWPHNDANNTLALTTVTFDPGTGEIYDADMEINTAGTKMAITNIVPDDGFDFASIVTHETGHFLGMAHSGDSRATMFAHYNPGSSVMRNLTTDDVEGICTIYPPSGTRAVDKSVSKTGFVTGDTCDPTPRHGFSTECGSEKPTSTAKCGASIAGVGTGAPGPLPFAAAFVTLATTCLARRRGSRGAAKDALSRCAGGRGQG